MLHEVTSAGNLAPVYHLELPARVSDVYINSAKLLSFYNSIYFKGFQDTVNDIEGAKQESVYNRWIKRLDTELDKKLKSEDFTSILASYVNSLVELRALYRKMGSPVEYMDRIFDGYVRSIMVFASVPRAFTPTPFDIVHVRGKSRLLHYRGSGKTDSKPLLIVYAPINRFHIMDLTPERSVVRELLSKGLDVYLLDWGYPTWDDDRLGIEDYISYIHDAVTTIKEASKSQVSMLGYCWGGILSLIYVVMYKENVKSLALMATPVDFSKDHTVPAAWAKAIDSDKIVDEFRHMDGQVLDLAFLMRNPPRYVFDKYVKFLQKMGDRQFVDTFLAVEKWLYDTPSIPGRLYRQIIDDCYKGNLLVQNKMTVGGRQIDLKEVDIPLLTVVAQKDDLTSPESTLAVIDCVSSKDKTSLESPGGHVGLCISSQAHERMWPDVAKWFLSK